ncbi:MAG: calcium/sodium antiporter [Planctomycetota bacterium]|nr:calcium/sodium antiporter [Planctomycetota bacterium]
MVARDPGKFLYSAAVMIPDLGQISSGVAVLVMLGGAGVLVLGAHLLVTAAVALARRARLSPFFIGATIVAVGTSVPELAASLYANLTDREGIALGNVLGSNVANLGLVLGAVALARPIPLKGRSMGRDLLVVVLVGLVPLLALPFDNQLTPWHGVVLLLLLAGYFYWTRQARHDSPPEARPDQPATRTWSIGLGLVLGPVMLVAGSQLFAEGAVVVGRGIGVPETVIGLTVVAFTTSLPELVTSIYAALKGQQELGVGNILGSCIMNVLGILGLVLLFGSIPVDPQIYAVDLPALLIVSVAAVPILVSGGRVIRMEGLLLLLMYLAYVTLLFVLVPGWFPEGPGS